MVLALAIMPRVAPLPVARSRVRIERKSAEAIDAERRRVLMWSRRMYRDLPSDVGSVAVTRDGAVCAVALLEKSASGVVVRDIAAFDDGSGTLLLRTLARALGTSLRPSRTLHPRWRVARAFFV